MFKLNAKLGAYNISYYDYSNGRLFGMVIVYLTIIGLFSNALYRLRIVEIIQNQQCVLRPLINLFAGMFLLGMITTITQSELISKPFSFCLPDGQKSIRKVIFLIGALITLGFSLIFFIFSEHTLLLFFLHIIVFPIICLPFYLFMAFIFLITLDDSFKKYIRYGFPAVSIILSVSFIINFKNDLIVPLNQIIIFCLAPLFISSLFGTSVLWKVLGDDQVGRIFHRKYFDLPDNLIQIGKKPHKLSQQELKNQNEIIGDIFFKKIVNQSDYRLIRSIWGTFYLLLERVWGYSGKSITYQIVLPSFLIFLFGYIQNNQEIDSFFITYPVLYFMFIYCKKIILIYKPISSELLFPIGRSKQFRINLMLWIVKPFTMMLWFSIIILASHNLNNYMPDFTLFGYSFNYTPLVVSLIVWPAVTIPVIDIFMSFPKPPCSLPTMVCFIITLIVLAGFFFVHSDLKTQVISMTSMIFISNIFYLILLSRYWFKSDLIQQGK